MTTGRTEVPLLDVTRWAAEQLGLPAEASAEEVRTAFLKALPEHDFVPPEAWHQAVAMQAPLRERVLFPPALPGLLLVDKEQGLRGEVEEFAADFFLIPMALRHERWQEFCQRCAFSLPLAARLRALEPGLAIERTRAGASESRVAELGDHVCSLFVLRPAERALLRHDLLARMGNEMPEWELASQQLRLAQPAVAALEPALIGQLCTYLGRRIMAAKKKRKARTGLICAIALVSVAIVRLLFLNSSTAPRVSSPDSHAPQPDPELQILMEEMKKGKPLDSRLRKLLDETRRRRFDVRPAPAEKPAREKQRPLPDAKDANHQDNAAKGKGAP